MFLSSFAVCFVLFSSVHCLYIFYHSSFVFLLLFFRIFFSLYSFTAWFVFVFLCSLFMIAYAMTVDTSLQPQNGAWIGATMMPWPW
jgi:hypothetical protein